MMRTINYLTDEAIETIKENIDGFYEEMKKHPLENDWIAGFLRLDPFLPSKYQIDFDFAIGDSGAQASDYANAVSLYESFKKAGIPDIVIYDEKFLAGFALTIGYRYFFQRMGLEKKTRLENTLFFSAGTRRSVAQNTIGRLYKLVCLSVDPASDDPYGLTRFAFENPSVLRIAYYTFADNKRVSLAYLKALKKWHQESGGKLTMNVTNKVRSKLSLLCNVTVAEDLQEATIMEFLGNYLASLNE